jgi:hypothetical protein
VPGIVLNQHTLGSFFKWHNVCRPLLMTPDAPDVGTSV